ncbi:reverse transcriptase domain-containing protein [Candidatus Erwinia dacicola]|uniref:reverse transcriptase domain-containing protein n=1 Tax=Candidatus Erwinia dacicola TaxID=252393 RepID=UPI001392200B|nr:reverse transcriptase domain-containing protein [Candidatus Erwinia dacicola]
MEMWKHKFEVKKNRWVHVPTKEMSLFGKKLHQIIRKKWKAPNYYYHLRNGGHVTAAKIHLGNDYFSLIDISNFFESTSQSRVTRELKTIIPYEQAREIAKISTVRVPNSKEKKFSIPYGYPQSPILASLCLHNSYAGGILDAINKSGDVIVSVYMDDIIFSSKTLEAINQAFDLFSNALVKSRYKVNTAKTQRPSKLLSVFNLELSSNYLKVSSVRMVQFIKAYIESDNHFEQEGIAAYVHSVNPDQANRHFP